MVGAPGSGVGLVVGAAVGELDGEWDGSLLGLDVGNLDGLSVLGAVGLGVHLSPQSRPPPVTVAIRPHSASRRSIKALAVRDIENKEEKEEDVETT